MKDELGRGTLLIVSHGNDLEYLNIILNILEDKRHEFRDVMFLDLSSILDDQDTFNRSILKMIGKTSPDEAVFSRLESLGYEVFRVERLKKFESLIGVPAQVINEIEDSVASALISRTGDEFPEKSKWLSDKSNKYRLEGVISFNSVRDYLIRNTQISEVAIINGRFPCQRGVIEAAKSANISWRSYERGSYEMSLPPFLYNAERYFRAVNYWYAPFPTYARVEKQDAILRMNLSNEQIHSSDVENWFLLRRKSGGTNRFAEEWKDMLNKKSSRGFAVLFTSSVDEFAELGSSWKEAEWKDQWEAFEYLIPQLLKQNYRPVLRVHPNLSNKPAKTRNATRGAINILSNKFPELEVIEPSSPTNSYTLLERADLAIVWISTMGLEASQMGIRTVCLSSSEYDLVADVKRWLNEDQVNFEELHNWKVDTTRSLRFIAGIFALDHKAKQLLPKYGVNPNEFAKGLTLFSNKWAMRNTNNLANLLSILMPSIIFVRLRKIIRRARFKLSTLAG